ncbi:tRNA pseudouridine synthase A, mitochondrial [Carica papaya]|uniref:tRNA pseudouridine synthase A, mitochondrial n=1 Tax=Carica papaya TaxID=3649 RepID=UPI000B8CAC71|nr:tRNA pseudouridine synthase A, mitochondrial [Carica papaya]
MGKRSFEKKSVTVQSSISSNNGAVIVNPEVEESSMVSKECGDVNMTDSEVAVGTNVFTQNEIDACTESSKKENDTSSDSATGPAQNEDAFGSGLPKELRESVEEEEINGEDKPVKRSEFCYGLKEKERFNKILKHYVGSHNFHNFTTRTKAEDPSAQRYIVSFHANTTVNVEGIEFVKCEVVGQSFMLHQIRKMIGLAVAIMRNCASEELFDTAFQKDVNINVPSAPEVGLYLDECLFASYNQKWKDSHEELSMKDYEEEAEAFKMKHIYSHIASTEHKDGVVALWLHSLNHRNYPDLCVVRSENIAEKEGDGVEKNGVTAETTSGMEINVGIIQGKICEAENRSE